jgi:hypothetical protein
MDRRANLCNLRLNDLLLRPAERKDAQGHARFFQSQNLVQDKGL